ncbi:MAG: hypothetical protein ACRCWF_09565 [Beijerinckiaceae bacterium]
MTSVWLSPELKAIRAGRMPRALSGGGLGSLWSDAPVQRFVLRRSGHRPVVFNGMLLLEHTNTVADESVRRHTVRLYETDYGRFMLEITLDTPDNSCIAHAMVEDVASLAEAEDMLRSYDPSGQAALALELSDEADGYSIARMALSLERDAARLRADFETTKAALFASAETTTADMLQRVN